MLEDTPNFMFIQTDAHALPVSKCNDPNPIISTICLDVGSNLGTIFFWEIARGKDKSFALKFYDCLRNQARIPRFYSRAYGWLAFAYARLFQLQVEYSGTDFRVISPRKLLLKKARVIRDLLGVELIHYIVSVGDECNYDFYITELTEKQLSAIPLNRLID